MPGGVAGAQSVVLTAPMPIDSASDDLAAQHSDGVQKGDYVRTSLKFVIYGLACLCKQNMVNKQRIELLSYIRLQGAWLFINQVVNTLSHNG